MMQLRSADETWLKPKVQLIVSILHCQTKQKTGARKIVIEVERIYKAHLITYKHIIA